MSTLYFSSLPPLSSSSLRRLSDPKAYDSYSTLPPSLQRAVSFAWQWLNGQQSFVITTSGSTGPPKTIELTRQQMVASIRNTRRALALSSEHTALLCIDPAYVGGMMLLARALEIGMDVVGVPPATQHLQRLPVSANFLALVPLQLQSLLASHPDFLNAAHAILVGGAPVGSEQEKVIRTQLFSPVYSTYGMTETASHVALRRLNGPDPEDAFRVLGDTQIGTDARGCLTLCGAVTQHQWVVTNDRVELVDEQRFRWRGRHDAVINSGGVKVSPEMVERVAATQWKGTAAPPLLVVGLPDKHLGERIVLIVEGSPDSESDQRHLLRAVAEKVPRYHAPRQIFYVKAIPRTSNGKLNRPETVALLLRTVG